jgi:hypothetical protein
MAENSVSEQELANRVYIGPNKTGDNIDANRSAGYQWDGANWQRSIFGIFTAPYDELDWSNPDSNGNYQTIISKLSGTSQQTLSLTFDGSNNITKITRP